MSMNIYALKGHRVKCSTFDAGYDSQKKIAQEHLSVGNEYTVDRTDVDSWQTYVYLKEIPGVAFNSVFFEDVVKQPKSKDKLHDDWARYNR